MLNKRLEDILDIDRTAVLSVIIVMFYIWTVQLGTH